MPRISPEDRVGRRLRFRDLQVLFAVVQCGSMAKAATQLGLTQPAVSDIIAGLEQIFSAPLFDRNPRGVEPTAYGKALRQHWGIENNLHWQLDVTFGEDGNRVQRRHGAENLALLRRLALTLLKRHGGKESIACKRYIATLDPTFLEEILVAGCNSGKG